MAAKFNKLMARLGLIDCQGLLPNNEDAVRCQRPLEMFFPFAPLPPPPPRLLPGPPQVLCQVCLAGKLLWKDKGLVLCPEVSPHTVSTIMIDWFGGRGGSKGTPMIWVFRTGMPSVRMSGRALRGNQAPYPPVPGISILVEAWLLSGVRQRLPARGRYKLLYAASSLE